MSAEHGATDRGAIDQPIDPQSDDRGDRRRVERPSDARIWTVSERTYRELLARFGGRQTAPSTTQQQTDRHSAEREPSALTESDERINRR